MIRKGMTFIALGLLAHTMVLAQGVENVKWHRFVFGGNKGYYVKTNVITPTTMTENQFGSGGAFDNSPMEINVAGIEKNGDLTVVITRYSDSMYYPLVFKNITATKAQVCLSTTSFKTVEETAAYVPGETEFTDWYTEKGYAAELKKPVMPEMTRKDVISFVNMVAKTYTEINQRMKESTTQDKGLQGLATAMVLSVLPGKFAESKGYSAFKSLAVVERGVKKYKNDAEVKKILKSAGL